MSIFFLSFTFFEHPSVLLIQFYNVIEFPTNQNVKRGMKIKAQNGKRVLLRTVFSEFIKFLKDHAVDEVWVKWRIRDVDIQWVLTVPAIWSEPAKAFMRDAAIEVSAIICLFLYVTADHISVFIPRQRSWGLGYSGFTMAVCPSARLPACLFMKKLSAC